MLSVSSYVILMLALQANATAATLQQENAQLSASLDDANSKVSDLESAVKAHEIAQDSLQQRILALQ